MFDSRTISRPLFVLGIDRSGTSLLSEILYRWGAHAGEPEHLPAPNAGNPHGFWEYKPMQDFVAELINEVGLSTWDPSYKPLMRRLASESRWRRRALELAAEMEQPDRPWFWKEPEFVLALPFWTQIVARPVCLITLRNPWDSAVSYGKFWLPGALREKMDLTGYFFLRWQYFMIYILEELRSYEHKILVSYEDLVSAPLEQCRRIGRFLAAEYGLDAGGDAARADEMARAIDPGLWRNNQGRCFLEAPRASRAQKELYSYMRDRLDGDVEDFDPARYPFAEASQEYMDNIAVFGWVLNNL